MASINVLVDACHSASKLAGWWNDLHTGNKLPLTQERVGDKLMLVVTEIAEAKEGHRKNKMDEHLPNRTMIEVELADAVIRIADLAGALGLDLGGAALNPKRIFSRASAVEQIKVRLDDKISRLMNQQPDEDEDVEWDLMGYLVLLRIARNKAASSE